MTPQQYHDGTKHHFHRFAPSLGFLDWASQPAPFRAFAGAPPLSLYPFPVAAGRGYAVSPIEYDRLFAGHPSPATPVPLSAGAIGDVLRHALGLSAWKQFGASRWSLRVNPSSGNLHPTEAYVLAGPDSGLGPEPGSDLTPALAPEAALFHYAADRHALELRSAFDSAAWASACGDPSRVWLVALTSIHWRESWKYGERAFRYCQHDLGHAVAAIRLAASLVGWQATMLPEWSHGNIAALTGIDRDEDYVDAEREDPACLLAIITPQPRVERENPRSITLDWTPLIGSLVDAVGRGRWSGRASQLSEAHVEWTFIDEVARATVDLGRVRQGQTARMAAGVATAAQAFRSATIGRAIDARALILRRRSAVAFDGRSSIGRSAFITMLDRVMPAPTAPWDALWWTPRIHLALFVHRVDGVDPGMYLLPRDGSAVDRLKASLGRECLWEQADDRLPLLRLGSGDCRRLAQRLSCDQDIAADGFFSLGMLADFDESLREHGPSFYRHLFWESGVVGQVLYLEAEAAGARATGIGCFYDDPVHEALGITDHSFQSLYHFTVGAPVDDARLTTEPGYGWEA